MSIGAFFKFLTLNKIKNATELYNSMAFISIYCLVVPTGIPARATQSGGEPISKV
jgi:hypothetical protein